MPGSTGHRSVEIAADFRDQLIIDRYDQVFANMRASKRKQLHAADRGDAVTWNVFRSLRQVASSVWLPELFLAAFPDHDAPAASHALVSVWQTVPSPPSLLDDAEEGEAEIDVVIEAPGWVWFIEGKLGGDLGSAATRKDRGQVLRCIDLGSYYAGVRDFYFSLLVGDPVSAQPAMAAVNDYRDLARPRELLGPHRPDGLGNLRGVSLLRWQDLAEVLADVARAKAAREDERGYAERALAWMKGI